MAPLLAVGLSLVALAVVPRSGRPAVLVALAAVEAAFAVKALTEDTFLVAAAALVAGLLAIVVREILSTLHLLTAPTPGARRERQRETRADARDWADWDRERRREQRERQRASRQDRLAA
jgi:hypothetical protein